MLVTTSDSADSVASSTASSAAASVPSPVVLPEFEAVVPESELPHPANRDVTIAAHISALNTFLLI